MSTPVTTAIPHPSFYGSLILLTNDVRQVYHGAFKKARHEKITAKRLNPVLWYVARKAAGHGEYLVRFHEVGDQVFVSCKSVDGERCKGTFRQKRHFQNPMCVHIATAKRWADNVERYVNLSCVKVILPWSTPAMRFCRSELKTTIIQRWIRKTFNEPVICVLGIRRDESRHRAKAPVFKPYEVTIKDGKEKMPALPVGSVDWNPIVEVKTETVFQILRASEMPMPSSYGFDADRYSCAFCVMATLRNLKAGTRDHRNHDLYREQCELEIVSTFSFQDHQWLSDVAPELLTEDQRARLPLAKEAAKLREQIESVIPKHLLYVKGWPVVMPTMAEAQMLADIRKRTGEVMNLAVKYTTALQVWNRYDELMRLKDEKDRKKRKKAA